MRRRNRWRGLAALGLTAIAMFLAAVWIWLRTQPVAPSAPAALPEAAPQIAPTHVSSDIDAEDRKALEDVLRRKGGGR